MGFLIFQGLSSYYPLMPLSSPFPNWVFFASTTEGEPLSPLLPEETALLTPNASNTRIAQFTLGRSAAHKALTAAGLPSNTAITRSPNSRAPRWPEGWIGSIAHSDTRAVAVIASTKNAQGLGIDIENLNEPVSKIEDRIATPLELQWLKGKTRTEAVTLFSLKESVYKALAPLTSDALRFKDVEIRPGPHPSEYLAALTRPISGISQKAQIVLVAAKYEGIVITGCILSD